MRLGRYFWFSVVILSVKGWSPTFRLQGDAIPNSYSLKFVPHPEKEVFSGEATILVKIQRSLNNITLNSRKLSITEITLDQSFGTTGYELDKEKELLHIFHKDGHYINPGEHIVNIKFIGRLVNSFHGFYSFMYSKSGVSSTILATKFSPNNARAAFPCFDEPSFKAVFSIRLVKPNGTWTALSNMKKIGYLNTLDGPAVDFQTTIPMSTYLLAWIITDFPYEEIYYQSKTKNVPLRFFSVENKSTIKREALKITKKCLQFFENYTGIPYPLSKLDSIEIPSYVSRGMEHFGLIVYQANSITHDPLAFSSRLIHSIDATELIAHEVSHMWFGNLVTHGWYNDLWLTEGFARFMQYKATFAILKEPFEKMMFKRSRVLWLFKTQCRIDWSLPTAGYPSSLQELRLKFSPATYDQGAAILMMIENVIGAETLQEIIRAHLQNYQYSHATTGDFITSVERFVPNINLRNFMETYLYQKKLPLILVTEDQSNFILKQTSFCENGTKSFFGDKWTVPIQFITSSNNTPRMVWLDRDMIKITIPKSKDDKWIKINYMYWGLYYTSYSEKNYLAIKEDFKNLPPIERGPFIEEIFLMALSGRVMYRIPLQFLIELRNITDMDFMTYTFASRGFSMFISELNFPNDILDILKSYFIHIFEPLYAQVGWLVKENESIDRRLLRLAVLESLCLYNYKYVECYKDAESIKLKNITLHEDIDYIYKKVLNDMDKVNSPVPKSAIGLSSPSTNISMTKQEEECASWVKTNIPKFIGQPDQEVHTK